MREYMALQREVQAAAGVVGVVAATAAGAEGVLEVTVDEADMMTWTVRLAFPEASPLGADLRAYHARSVRQAPAAPTLVQHSATAGGERDAVVTLELRMPPDFPASPPFVRVVSPRFQFHTGHVTVGGSLCMELLTSVGWRAGYTIQSVLVQVRAAMLDGGGRLDPRRPHVPYGRDEAWRAFWRVARQHGWEHAA